jgi:hypothetical protein
MACIGGTQPVIYTHVFVSSGDFTDLVGRPAGTPPVATT